jgi:hypothetical protein
MIEMQLGGLGFDPKNMSPIVLLRDTEERNFLPIWIGMFEAAAIAMELQEFKSCVIGRGALNSCNSIAIAAASNIPIHIGRKLRSSVSLSNTIGDMFFGSNPSPPNCISIIRLSFYSFYYFFKCFWILNR